MKKLTFCLFSALLLTACGGSNDASNNAASSETTSAAKASPKIYKVAVEREFAPLIIPTEKGAMTGFEYDVLQEIAKKQGLKVQFDIYPWHMVFPQLDSGHADIAGSGIAITEERLKKWDFSEPYVQTNYAMVLPNDSKIQNMEELKTHKIAVQSMSSSEEYLKNYANQLATASSPWLAIKEVMVGHTEAAAVDGITASYYLNKYPKENLKMVPMGNEVLNLGFAVKKGNLELLKKLNDGLAQIKSDGTYNQLKAKWSIN